MDHASKIVAMAIMLILPGATFVIYLAKLVLARLIIAQHANQGMDFSKKVVFHHVQ